jgi:Uma2 family endonuclease
MSAALKSSIRGATSKGLRISVEDYLASELASPVKREYVGGMIFAMAGARNAHNVIAMNILGVLFGKLRGKPCQPFNSDTKVRVRLRNEVRFYYPDAFVVCQPNRQSESFQDTPAVIVEVLSRTTRRTDTTEELDAYLTIPSLSLYLLVEQEECAIAAYRRTDQGFVRESYTQMSDIISLTEIGAELPLAEIYERVEFTPETDVEVDE